MGLVIPYNMKLKITHEKITEDLVGKIFEFPKYTTQLMNLANQNAQGTRPKVVGQMSDLIQEFPKKTYDEWVEWYNEKMPDAIEWATDKVLEMIESMKEAMNKIDRTLVKQWVTDLVLTKTFTGLCFQESILKTIAERKGVSV